MKNVKRKEEGGAPARLAGKHREGEHNQAVRVWVVVAGVR